MFSAAARKVSSDIEGLTVLEAFSVTRSSDLWMTLQRIRDLVLGKLESIVLYSVEDGRLSAVVKENISLSDILRFNLSNLSSFALVRDSGLRRKIEDLGSVVLNGMMPRNAQAQASLTARVFTADRIKTDSPEVFLPSTASGKPLTQESRFASSTSIIFRTNGWFCGITSMFTKYPRWRCFGTTDDTTPGALIRKNPTGSGSKRSVRGAAEKNAEAPGRELIRSALFFLCRDLTYARKTWQRWDLCNENEAKAAPVQGKRGFTRRRSACIIYPKQLLRIEPGGT